MLYFQLNLNFRGVILLVDYIRVSIGTASKLGLLRVKMLAEPYTAYLMLYHEGKCFGSCAFCTQSITSTSNSEYLSRVSWPKFWFNDVLNALKSTNDFKRVCIQTLIYPKFFEDTIEIISRFRDALNIPISVSIHPRGFEDLMILKDYGVDRVGIGVDAASEPIFKRVKRPFSWDRTIKILLKAREIFGSRSVSAHLIYGLGDSDRSFIEFMYKLYSNDIDVGLFAFTPMEGTLMENHLKPDISSYRTIQLSHYLIKHGLVDIKDFIFDSQGKLKGIIMDKDKLYEIVESCEPFKTTGCPNCNRPFYNESPGEELYNYPTLDMALKDLNKIKMELKHLLN